MLSEMALKVLSVPMSLSTRITGNFFDKHYRRRRIWKQKMFSNVFRSLDFFL